MNVAASVAFGIAWATDCVMLMRGEITTSSCQKGKLRRILHNN
jgi:hypothetical protein